MSDVVSRSYRKDGRIVFEREQDVEPYLDANKASQSEDQGFAPDFHLIASIPNIFIEKWLIEDGIDYREIMSDEGWNGFIRKKLRDPDYAFLRTTNKRF